MELTDEEIKQVKEMIEENEEVAKSAKIIEKEVKESVKESVNLRKKYGEKAKPRDYDIKNIIKKEKELPVPIPLPLSRHLVCLPSNKNVEKYYDWVFYPHIEIILPSNKLYGEFSIDEVLPIIKHELLHTFHVVTLRTEEGSEIWKVQILLPQSTISCADMIECVGVDLAFYMEGWKTLGKLCKESVDAYQNEIGNKPYKKIFKKWWEFLSEYTH